VKCHRHPERDAIAVCKHCTKGICAECAVEGPGGTACGAACAEEIERVRAMLERSRRSLKTARDVPRATGWFLVICGLGFLAYAAIGSAAVRPLVLGAGTIFLLCGLAALWHYRQEPGERD